MTDKRNESVPIAIWADTNRLYLEYSDGSLQFFGAISAKCAIPANSVPRKITPIEFSSNRDITTKQGSV